MGFLMFLCRLWSCSLVLVIVSMMMSGAHAQLCTVPDRVIERAQPISHINEWRALTHAQPGVQAAGVDVVIVHPINTQSFSEKYVCAAGKAEPNAEELFFDTLSIVVDNLHPLARFWTVAPEVPVNDVESEEDIPDQMRESWRVLENVMEEAFINEVPAIVVVGEASEYNPFTGRAPRFLENVKEKDRLVPDRLAIFLATFVEPDAVGKLSMADSVGHVTKDSSQEDKHGHKQAELFDKSKILDTSLPYALLAFTGTIKRHISLKLVAARSKGLMHVSQFMFHDQVVRDHFGLRVMEDDEHAETPQLVLVNVTSGGSTIGILNGNAKNTWRWVGQQVSMRGEEERITVTEFKGEDIDSFLRENGVDIGASPDLADEAVQHREDDEAGTGKHEKRKQRTKQPRPTSTKTPGVGNAKKLKSADGMVSEKSFEAQMTLVPARDVELDVLSQSTPALVILADNKGSKEVESDIAQWASLVMELQATIHLVWVDTAKADGKDFVERHVDASAMDAVHPTTTNVHVFLHCIMDVSLQPLASPVEVGAVVGEAARVIRTWGGDVDLISTNVELMEAKERCRDDFSIIVASVGATESPPDLLSVILYPLSLEYGMEIAHIHGANTLLIDRFGEMLGSEGGGLVALLPDGKQERYRGAYTKPHVNSWFRKLKGRMQRRSFK